MKNTARVILRVLAWIWTIAALTVIVCAYVMIAIKEGVGAVIQMLSPFNVLNFLATLLLLSPGFFLFWLSDKFESSGD